MTGFERVFEDVVCADWGLLTDARLPGIITVKGASAWGVEHLNVEQRIVKLLDSHTTEAFCVSL